MSDDEDAAFWSEVASDAIKSTAPPPPPPPEEEEEEEEEKKNDSGGEEEGGEQRRETPSVPEEEEEEEDDDDGNKEEKKKTTKEKAKSRVDARKEEREARREAKEAEMERKAEAKQAETNEKLRIRAEEMERKSELANRLAEQKLELMRVTEARKEREAEKKLQQTSQVALAKIEQQREKAKLVKAIALKKLKQGRLVKPSLGGAKLIDTSLGEKKRKNKRNREAPRHISSAAVASGAAREAKRARLEEKGMESGNESQAEEVNEGDDEEEDNKIAGNGGEEGQNRGGGGGGDDDDELDAFGDEVAVPLTVVDWDHIKQEDELRYPDSDPNFCWACVVTQDVKDTKKNKAMGEFVNYKDENFHKTDLVACLNHLHDVYMTKLMNCSKKEVHRQPWHRHRIYIHYTEHCVTTKFDLESDLSKVRMIMNMFETSGLKMMNNKTKDVGVGMAAFGPWMALLSKKERLLKELGPLRPNNFL
jgi:hypothetical protein